MGTLRIGETPVRWAGVVGGNVYNPPADSLEMYVAAGLDPRTRQLEMGILCVSAAELAQDGTILTVPSSSAHNLERTLCADPNTSEPEVTELHPTEINLQSPRRYEPLVLDASDVQAALAFMSRFGNRTTYTQHSRGDYFFSTGLFGHLDVTPGEVTLTSLPHGDRQPVVKVVDARELGAGVGRLLVARAAFIDG